jgi:peptide/nickel transport system permease protein
MGKPAAGTSLWAEAWLRFKRHRLAYWSLWVLGLLVLAVLVGPLFYKVGINDIDFKARLAPPSWSHPMGTDDLGRDLMARVLYGGRISLAVGFASMVVGRCRADVGHRPVPEPAAAAPAAGLDLLLP